jgi:hypothetical protein
MNVPWTHLSHIHKDREYYRDGNDLVPKLTTPICNYYAS